MVGSAAVGAAVELNAGALDTTQRQWVGPPQVLTHRDEGSCNTRQLMPIPAPSLSHSSWLAICP